MGPPAFLVLCFKAAARAGRALCASVWASVCLCADTLMWAEETEEVVDLVFPDVLAALEMLSCGSTSH